MIIYASEYGTTKTFAGKLSGLLDVSVYSITDDSAVILEKIVDEEQVILMSDVIFLKINRSLQKFMKKNLELLLTKKVVILLVCGAPDDEKRGEFTLGKTLYLKNIPAGLLEHALLTECLYGRIDFPVNDKHKHVAERLQAQFLIEPFDHSFKNNFNELSSRIKKVF